MHLFKKTPSSVWILAPLVLLFSLLIVMPIAVIMYSSVVKRGNRSEFNAESWEVSGQPYGSNSTRLTMVDDLIHSQLLINKNREEVVSLLGETDGDPSIKDRFPDWQMHYYLGPSRSTILFKGDSASATYFSCISSLPLTRIVWVKVCIFCWFANHFVHAPFIDARTLPCKFGHSLFVLQF